MMKKLVLRFVQCVAYWLGIDAIFYCLNRKAKRVVCFHHVLPDGIGRVSVNGFELNETSFRAILRELQRYYAFSVDFSDPRTLTLTFDDGWRDQFTIAARILHEQNIPAVLFTAGEMIDNKTPLRALSVELLEHWIAFVPFGKYELVFDGEKHLLDVSNERDRATVGRILRPLFLSDGNSRGRSLMAALDRAYPMSEILASLPPEYVEQRLSGISSDELNALRSRGWLVGWHTNSHFPLKQLSRDDQRQELTCPAGFDKSVMAYPFGSHDALDGVATDLVRQLGYGCAFSFLVEPTCLHNRYFLPRFLIPEERYALHFELSGLKYFLKYRSLLPKIKIENV